MLLQDLFTFPKDRLHNNMVNVFKFMACFYLLDLHIKYPEYGMKMPSLTYKGKKL
jgi:hypothetical protein